MPELPEVEVTRIGLASQVVGALVTGVHVGKPLRWPLGCTEDQLVGKTIVAVRRRGKYLLIDLALPGEAAPALCGLLLLHLGMSGRVVLEARHSEPGKHDHFDLMTTAGLVRLHDPRRFGAAVYAPSEQAPVAHKLLGNLGVEPLSAAFSDLGFYQALRGRSTAIKQVLLAGQIVVGVGNIYASEALFMAGIRPTTAAKSLSKPRAARLAGAIRQVLSMALSLGGSTLRDFANAQGQSGYFQLQAKVYGRDGEPCRVCGTNIVLLRQAQRSTFYCKSCQKT